MKYWTVIGMFFLTMNTLRAQQAFQPLDLTAVHIDLPIQYLPPLSEQNDSLFPAVLFLHGSGERGTDNQKQLTHGGDFFLSEENRTTYPCHVFFPQCPDTIKWVNYPYFNPQYDLSSAPSYVMDQLVQLVNWISLQKNVDPTRIYIMGLSMGGFATWELAFRQSDKIAAVVPICGGGDPRHAGVFMTIPSRMYHGEKDLIISVQQSLIVQNAILQQQAETGNTASHELILLPDYDHNSWDAAFADKQLLPWLFDQRK